MTLFHHNSTRTNILTSRHGNNVQHYICAATINPIYQTFLATYETNMGRGGRCAQRLCSFYKAIPICSSQQQNGTLTIFTAAYYSGDAEFLSNCYQRYEQRFINVLMSTRRYKYTYTDGSTRSNLSGARALNRK